MKKNKTLLRLMLCIITTLLCIENLQAQKKYTLSLAVQHDSTIKGYTLYYYQHGKNIMVKGKKNNDKYLFEDTLSYSCLANIIVEKKGAPEMVFNFSILEPGVEIKGVAINGMNEVHFTGSPTQENFTKFKKVYDGLYDRSGIAREHVLKANANKDSVQMYYYSDLRVSISDSIRSFQEAFFQANPASLVTALMLPTYVTYDWVNLKKAEEIYAKLGSALQSNPEVVNFYKSLQKAKHSDYGKDFPKFILPSIDSALFSSDRLKGKYVLIDFWASWCGPCRDESPFLKQAYSKYKHKGFEIVGISIDNNKNAWIKAINKDGLTWTNLVDASGTFAEEMNVSAIPRNFLINPEGKIIASGLRDIQLIKQLNKIFD
jgi:thiol-disulfide isomerase/thioredoxin